LAAISPYERSGGRNPAQKFLDEIERPMRKKFIGQFDALSKQGASYENEQRFRPLRGKGKPLWEFKEHDHRLYCSRSVVDQSKVEIVLLSGWVKDKEGKTDKEDREIKKALDYMNEMEAESQARSRGGTTT
jgi:hypothetical protein